MIQLEFCENHLTVVVGTVAYVSLYVCKKIEKKKEGKEK
jgi:hypothetical protein